MIYLCKEADIFDIDIYIDIYICWYLYLLDICNQDSLYNLTLVYVVISDRNTFSEETSVTLTLCLKWPLNYLLPVFPSIPHTANEREKIILSNPQFQRKTEIIEIFVLFIFLWCFTAIPSFWFMVNDATNIGHLEKYHLTKKIQEYYSNFNKETVGVD